MKFTIANPLFIHELGQRSNQEDSLFPSEATLNDGSRVFILCDGMGGHDSGEVASSTVCQTMGKCFIDNPVTDQLSREQFELALAAAYDSLDAKENPESLKKMGTTMTFLCLHSAGATAAHIGDSRIYQIRPGEKLPVFKTRDHSLVNDLIRLGEMTEEEAKTSKNRNVITRAMQPCQERRSKADMSLLSDVRPGDWFYMCSDGMLEQMDDTEIVAILADSSKSDQEKRQILIDRTAGNKDNHTAFLIHILDVSGSPEKAADDLTDEMPVVAAFDEDNETPEPDRTDSFTKKKGNELSGQNIKTQHAVSKKESWKIPMVIVIFLLVLVFAAFLAISKNGSSNDSPEGNAVEQTHSNKTSTVQPQPVAQPVAPAGQEGGQAEVPDSATTPNVQSLFSNPNQQGQNPNL